MSCSDQHYLRHSGWRCKRGCASQCSQHRTSLHRRCGCGLQAGLDWGGCSWRRWSDPKLSSWPGLRIVLLQRAAPEVNLAEGASSPRWRLELCNSIMQFGFQLFKVSSNCCLCASRHGKLQHGKQERRKKQLSYLNLVIPATPWQTFQPTTGTRPKINTSHC